MSTKYGVQVRGGLLLRTPHGVLHTAYFVLIQLTVIDFLYRLMSNPSEKRCIGISIRFAHFASIAVMILASSSILLAAEKPGPSGSDPILADLKTMAEAKWWPSFENDGPTPPSLVIVVDFHGTAAAKASSVGETNLNSVLDENGKSYRWQCQPNGIRWNGLYRLNNCGDIECRRGDDVLFYLTIPNRPTAKFIRDLHGSVAMQTGGEHHKVIVKDALKNVPLSSQEKDGTPPTKMKNTISDRHLDALGIKVAVERRQIDDDLKARGIKDGMSFQVQSDDPVLEIAILDKDGKTIAESPGRDFPFQFYDLNASKPIPSDAQLQLVVHKNSRQVRVPFALHNIPVPEINKHDKSLNIPALPDDAFIEAEPVLPDNPILDGMKFHPEARFEPSSSQSLHLIVDVALQGGPSERATAYGEVSVESASDDAGRPLVFVPCMSGMQRRFSHATDIDADPIAVELATSASFPVQRIHQLRGTVALQAGGCFEVVAVKEFLKKVGNDGRIDDPKLKALGISAKVENQKNSDPANIAEELNIELRWKRNAVVSCDFCDSEGQRLGSGDGIGSGDIPNLVNWHRTFERPVPANAELHLVVHRNSRKLRVPFELQDIAIPPAPKGHKDAMGSDVAGKKKDGK